MILTNFMDTLNGRMQKLYDSERIEFTPAPFDRYLYFAVVFDKGKKFK